MEFSGDLPGVDAVDTSLHQCLLLDGDLRLGDILEETPILLRRICGHVAQHLVVPSLEVGNHAVERGRSIIFVNLLRNLIGYLFPH